MVQGARRAERRPPDRRLNGNFGRLREIIGWELVYRAEVIGE
jgi:hypothetical protein